MSVPVVQTNPQAGALIDVSNFEIQLKRAEIMSNAPFLPDVFRGNPGAVLIAVELADRLNLPVMAVCQSIYVVHGKPAFSGSFYISCINASGRFSPVDYEEQRDGENITGCRVVVTRKGSGKTVYGPWVTMEMAAKEGWTKNNPKWVSMPELMLRYRAASFFARTHCPDVVMGFSVEGEVEDIPVTEDARVETPAKISPAYEPDTKVQQYAEALRTLTTRKELQQIQKAIGLDDKLTTADKDFLRPIAVAKGRELDNQ